MSRTTPIPHERGRASVRYAESLALAAVFVHAGQDLMRGEPAALGIPAWAFAGGFFLYAVLVASASEATPARVLLTGGVPVVIGVFHLIAAHDGGFFVQITYANIVFGAATLVHYPVLD